MPDPILPEPADFRPPRARRAGRPLSASARRRARRRRVVAFSAVGAIVLVGVGGGVALAATNDGGQRYRTASVERASVEQQIDSVGTIASAQRRDMAFSVAGTVGTVAVKVGDAVKAGQTLATLDPASLQDAIDSANSALATAQQQLSDDLASQTSSTSTSSTSSTSTASSSTRSSSSSTSGASTQASSAKTGAQTQQSSGSGSSAAQDPAVTSAASAVHDAQQALLAQADKADTALKASSDAVTTSQTTCQALLDLTATSSSSSGSGSDPSPSPSASPTDSPSPAPSASADSSSGSDASEIATALKACQDAIAAAQTAQKATSDAQAQLTTLSAQLDQAVAAYQKALEQSARSGSTGTGQQGGASTPSTGSGASTPSTGSSTSSSSSSSATRSSSPSASSSGGSFSSGGASSGPASAATILADRAAVTTAQANVDVATSKSDLATLTSPFAGTVAAVSMKVGDPVAASSSSEVITVIGTDGYTVTTSVPLSRIDIVKVGQDATVTTPSAKGTLAGKVTSIGVLDVSTTSDPAYQVEIALSGGDQPIYNGASAQVQISVAGASQVLTVPTSAVHVESGAASVEVLQAGKPVTVSVTRGAVGTDRTEITSGLTLGEQVVLADLQATIASSSTSSTSRGLSSLGGSQTTQFGGQFPGGGFGGGGFGGGGFTGGGFGGQGGGKG